jgi:hypothetical protein
LLAGLLLAAASLRAQTTETPVPAASVAKESRHKHGYLRFWNMLPKEAGELVLLKDNGTPEGEPILSAAPANYYASYITVPVGRHTLKLVRREAPTGVIQTVDVTLRGNDSFTILASAFERRLKLETLDDTYDPTVAIAGRLIIRHYFPDARVTVGIGSQTRSRELAAGETETIEGLPLQSFELKMSATLPGGKTENWSSEVNFQTTRHATLLVVPDPYGRFRPRLALDGHGPRASTPAP